MAHTLDDIKTKHSTIYEEMKNNIMKEAAEDANKLCQKAKKQLEQTQEQTQEKQKLNKIIEETERLQRHIKEARKEDIPYDAADIQPESPKETEVLTLQQKIYKGLQKTKEECQKNMKDLKSLIGNKDPNDKQKQAKQQIEDLENKMQKIQNEMWNEYYMKIACLAALRSKDPRTPVSSLTALHLIIQCHTQVGACIVDREKEEIVGIGYNSMPYIEDDDNDTVFPWKSKHKNKEENKYKQVHPELKHAYGN